MVNTPNDFTLRETKTLQGATPAELENFNYNWWLIQNALRSLGAVNPGAPIPVTIPVRHDQLLELGDDDHLQYLLLAGRNPFQTIYGNSIPIPSASRTEIGLILSTDSTHGGVVQFGGLGNPAFQLNSGSIFGINGSLYLRVPNNTFRTSVGGGVPAGLILGYYDTGSVKNYVVFMEVTAPNTANSTGFIRQSGSSLQLQAGNSLLLTGSTSGVGITLQQNGSGPIFAGFAGANNLFQVGNSGDTSILVNTNAKVPLYLQIPGTSTARFLEFSKSVGGVLTFFDSSGYLVFRSGQPQDCRIEYESTNKFTIGIATTIAGKIFQIKGNEETQQIVFRSGGTVPLTIKGASTENLLDFRNSIDTLLSYIDKDGKWNGPINTFGSTTSFKDTEFELYDNLDSTKKAVFQLSGIATGFTRTFTFPDIDGTIVVPAQPYTWVGIQTHNAKVIHNGDVDVNSIMTVDVTNGGSVKQKVNNAGLDIALYLYDGSGNDYSIQVPVFFGNITLSLPAAGGTVVTTSATQNILGKSLTNGGIGLLDQINSIGATNIVQSGSTNAGLYEVEVYAICTAQSAVACTLDVTIGWNDGTARTLACTANDPAGLWTLDLTTTNYAMARFVVYRNSGNITYATTVTGGDGNQRYSLFVRILRIAAN